MKLAPISFTGLWINKGSDGKVSNYEYRPFSNETKAQAQEIVDEYNGKTRMYFLDDDDCEGETTIINAKVGKTLNITSDEYAKNLPYGPRQTYYSDDAVVIG